MEIKLIINNKIPKFTNVEYFPLFENIITELLKEKKKKQNFTYVLTSSRLTDSIIIKPKNFWLTILNNIKQLNTNYIHNNKHPSKIIVSYITFKAKNILQKIIYFSNKYRIPIEEILILYLDINSPFNKNKQYFNQLEDNNKTSKDKLNIFNNKKPKTLFLGNFDSRNLKNKMKNILISREKFWNTFIFSHKNINNSKIIKNSVDENKKIEYPIIGGFRRSYNRFRSLKFSSFNEYKKALVPNKNKTVIVNSIQTSSNRSISITKKHFNQSTSISLHYKKIQPMILKKNLKNNKKVIIKKAPIYNCKKFKTKIENFLTKEDLYY